MAAKKRGGAMKKSKNNRGEEALKSKNNSGPVTVAIPNTTQAKMAAIVSLSAAVADLARALVSVQTVVSIQNCHFDRTRTGITVTGDR